MDERIEEQRRIKKAVHRLYEEMGFCVIPCHHPMEPPPAALVETGAWNEDLAGKRPTVPWKRYQNVSPSQEEIAEWFYGSQLNNIAILTGPISRVAVVDLDDAEAVSWAQASLPPTPLRVSTSRGEHWYYRWDSSKPIGNQARLNTGSRTLNADIRGDGGYVLAPGSRHRSGALYKATPDAKAWHAKTIELLPVFPRSLFEKADSPKPAALSRAIDPRLERRLMAYVAQCSGKPAGERNNAAYQLAANLLVDFEADPTMAWDLLVDWNQRNTPPLAERELRATFASAEKSGSHERGWKRKLDRRERPVLRLIQGGATEGSLALAPQPAQKPQSEPLRMLSWDELPADAGWEFVLEPAIPRGTVTILSGDGGLGKSLLACRLVVCLAAGNDWLGRPVARPMRSTVFFLEDTLGEVKRRLKDSGYENDGRINVFDNRETILSLSKEDVAAVAESAEAHGSDLIVIDPLVSVATAAGVDMNKPEEIRAVVDLLSSVAKVRRMGILLIAHHNSQGTIQGGKAWSNAVRSHLAVYRHPLDFNRMILVHVKNNVGEMVSILYKIGEATPDVPSSAVAMPLWEVPTWNYERFREVANNKSFDPGSVREALAFLRRQIKPGMRREKRKLMDQAAADGIRSGDLGFAANILGIRRDYVPQPHGQPDLLCWEMPEDGGAT